MKLKRLYIETHQEFVVYMRRDCPVFRAEGFQSMARVQVRFGERDITATLNVVRQGLLADGEAGLSESAWVALAAVEGGEAVFSPAMQVESMPFVRSKMYGNRLTEAEFRSILSDIIQGHYANIEIAAFIAACSGDRLDLSEIMALTKAMVDTGQKLKWESHVVVDKHCIGGIPGNRTSPIVVAIVAEAGLPMPKTSSRAITSPAGTADTMEVLTDVVLTADKIRDVVTRFNGCFAWGGSVNLSPADDILIRVERALDVDSEGQMIASVLSKKAAAGSTHVIIDLPVGPTAKVRSHQAAEKLKYYFNVVGEAIGIRVQVLISDGSQPVGFGIGPALEALDVLSVLRCEPLAPEDLRERSVTIAAAVLEFAGRCAHGEGEWYARSLLESGAAYRRFVQICKAQGRFTEPVPACCKRDVLADREGTVGAIHNRKIAKVAKLAGAPAQRGAGVLLHVKTGAKVTSGMTLYTVYAEAEGELNYALSYVRLQADIVTIT